MTFAWNLMYGGRNMTPHLKKIIVQEVDNGRNWFLNFFFKGVLIEQLDLELVRGTAINDAVKQLIVVNEDGLPIGSVLDRLQNAYDVNYFEYQAHSQEP